MLKFDKILATTNVIEGTKMKHLTKPALCVSAAMLFAVPAATAKTYVWDEAKESGNASEPSNWLADGVTATVAPGSGDDVIIQGATTNTWKPKVYVTLDENFTFKSLMLGDNAFVTGDKTINAGKLVLGSGHAKLVCGSASEFGRFESTGGCGLLETEPDIFTIRDTNSVKNYNGVAPHFAMTSSSGGPCEILKLTSDGRLAQAVDSDYVLDSIMSAGENDSVYLTEASSNLTLTADVTINALKIHNRAVLNLGGHTLTIKSGVIRPRRDSGNNNRVYCGTISNGTVKVLDQFFYLNGIGAATDHFNVTLDTTWNKDPLKQVFHYRTESGLGISKKDMSKVFGTYCLREEGYVHVEGGTNVIFDTGREARFRNGMHSDHRQASNVRGLAGNAAVTSNVKHNGKLWLGDTPVDEEWPDHSCVVGPNGYLVPGGLSCDGFREGSMRFDDCNSNLFGYPQLTFKPDSHLVTTVRQDGRATSVTTSGKSQYRCKVTINGGNLDVVEAGKVKSGSWTVMRTVDPLTGHDGKFFDSVTAGYKVKYNVEVVEDGVTYYEVQLRKNATGTYLVLR